MEKGVIYSITNLENDKVLIDSTTDFKKFEKSFNYAQKNNSPKTISQKIQKDWKKYGAEAFELAVLEEIVQENEQPLKEFEEELDELKEEWMEHFDEEELY